MKRLFMPLMCLILILTALPLSSLPAASLQAAPANQEEKVVRVGWYESAFHKTDQFGRRSGYGYEYQQRVAIFTGWKYEYVEGSWSDLYELLEKGEIDLLSDVSYTEERAQKVLYSAQGMGSEDYHAFISSDNTEIRPDDFSTFNGKRVGVNKNSIQEQLFIDWAEAHEVEPEIVELTGKSPELFDMLSKGEIDVLVTLDAYGNSADVVPVCKVGSSDIFFGINKKRPDLKKDLDVAMNRILEDNHNFNEQMTEKLIGENSLSSFLSPDEVDWLSDHGSIKVGYRENFLPFCGTDTGTHEVTGTLADFLSFAETAEKNADIRFEAYPYVTTEDALKALARGEIDCLFPVSLSAYDGEKLGVIITDTFIRTEMFVAVRTADRKGFSQDQEMTVAVHKGNPSYETFLMDYFPKWKAVYYEDAASSFQAVAAGEADCVLMSNYRLNRVGQLCTRYKLSTLTTGEAIDLAFAVRRDDDYLYSILNKTNRLMPDAALNASLSNYSFTTERVTFADYMRDNLVSVVAVTAVIVSIILLLLLWSVRNRMKADAGRQLISETERDHLTMLYNRNYFNVYANRLFSDHPDRPMDAIVMNIDRFHTLNTLNGRAFGDEVLKALADEIDHFLEGTDGIAGRLEGDHFNIYCDRQGDYQALLDRFQLRMNSLSRSADISLRMGVKPWQKDMEPEIMFDQAWTACSMVRGDFSTRLMVYDEDLRQHDLLNQRLRNDIGQALKEGQLEVYYQPKYDIRSEIPRLNSAEALVRWNHGELGMISPADFIPLFERSGQISAVDNYVWAEAARQVAAWRDRFGFILPVSVNLSRVDVFDSNLQAILDGLVDRYGLDRSTLKLEVTESAYTENADHLIQVIRQLREKGYEIEMDDFGSGYSSLNMLSSMPVDVLKMDMQFVQNIEHSETDMRLVKLILDIAQNLKLSVVAEGVETEGQLSLLKDAGCDLVQGYYFSQPLTAEEFEERILTDLSSESR